MVIVSWKYISLFSIDYEFNVEIDDISFSTITIVTGILGMFIGGYLVDKFGKLKMLSLYSALLTILIVSFAFLSK